MKRAFSLIEVIVVCAIIAVLVAILLPILSKTKARAGEIVCVSNLRQIGAAMEMYRTDTGDYPALETATLDGYLGHAKLRCPMKIAPEAYNFNAYGNNAFFTLSATNPPAPPEIAKYLLSLRACYDKRGSDFPLLVDINHLPKTLHPRDGVAAFVFVYRINGAVERVSKDRYVDIALVKAGITPPVPLPCSPDAQNGNL